MIFLYHMYIACSMSSLQKTDNNTTQDTSDNNSEFPVSEEENNWDGCRANSREADRERLLFYSTPYNEDISHSDLWNVHRISQAGSISESFDQLSLGRNIQGEVYFTPDSSWAAIITDNGSISTFSISTDNDIQMIVQQEILDIYISSIVIHPSGEYFYALDPNWPENGGGIYRIDIDCSTGELNSPSLIYTTKNVAELVFFGDGILVAARQLEDHIGYVYYISDDGEISSFDPFDGDENVILTDLVVNSSGNIFVSENAEFSGVPNRVAILNLQDGDFSLINLHEILDPVQLIASPYSNHIAVLSGYGNAVYSMNEEDFELVSYITTAPQLPTSAAQIEQGSLKGHFFITENQGVRTMKFVEEGGIEDLGMGVHTTGLSGITGGIGITP